MISKTSPRRAALNCGAATFVLALLAAPVAGLAQTAAPATTAAADAAAEADEGTIVVTGSLIRNPNLISASPVTTTTADTIQLRASNVAEEVLRDIPGIVPSIGSAVNNGNGGASFVDLRGIGSERNIVLLDGRRIVPSGLAGRVDLNNIPLALVERVDALTGAAVTTYGADAISGVVNFVTKQDFSGVDLQVGTGITERGDGQTFRSDLTIGANFDGGRGNATLSVGYQKADPVYQGARDFSITGVDSFSGAASGSGTAIPSRFSGTRPITGGVPNTLAPFTQTGTVPGPNGTTIPVLAPVTGGLANGGVRQIDIPTGQALVGLATPFNFNPFNIFQTPFERFNIYAQAKYQVADALEVYSRGLFSKNRVNTIIAPSGAFGPTVTIPLSNPFLPAGLRNQLCAFNVAPNVTGQLANGTSTVGQIAYTPRFSQAQCDAAARATSPTSPDYRTVDVTLNRRTTEYGPRISEFTTTIFDYQVGARGAISDNIEYDLSGGYGESENVQTLQGYVLTSRLRQSLLATNPTTCLNNTNGCVPINVFGPAGSIDPASASFLTAESTTAVKTTLGQVKGLISGETGFAIPFATDGVGFALGAEYRIYTATQKSDTLAQQAGELGGAGGAAPNIDGGYDVKEVYGELIAPLVQDKPFFQNLTLEAGARYSSYSVQNSGGRTYDTFTWKAGGTWEFVDGIKMRGNYSRAVRAPNIGELFTPVTTGLTNLGVDPCAGSAPVTNANLRAVCLAQGAPAGSIGSITNPTAGQAAFTSGGNLNIDPEKATTWTVGGVFQPSFAPGLSITVDYYNIRVTDAITDPLPGDIIAACFNSISASSATDPNCLAFGRNPITGGLDGDPSNTLGLIGQLSNLGIIKTSGIDATLNYSRDIGFAKLGVQFNANYTFESKFQAGPVSIDRDCVGYYSVNCSFTGSIQPEFQSSLRTTLGFDAFDLSLLWRHISGVEQEPLDVIDQGPFFEGFGEIKAYDYFDLSGRVNVLENLSVIFTASNIFDRQPPVVGSTAGSTTFNSGNTYPSTYDALGRRFSIQANLKF